MSDALSPFNREPIFWTTPRQGYNDRDRQRVRFENGRAVIERFPAKGHLGDYENRVTAPGTRYVTVVRHDGHSVFMVLTNGAAHLDVMTPFASYQRSKMRAFGWFPLGACPLALLANSELYACNFANQAIVTEQPCVPGSYSEASPCKHCLAEKAARAEINVESNARYKDNDPTERMMAANAANATTIADQVAKSFAALVGGGMLDQLVEQLVAQKLAAMTPPANTKGK